MTCPECGSDCIKCIRSYNPNTNDRSKAECLDCGCVYGWSMRLTIAEHGTEYIECTSKPLYFSSEYGSCTGINDEGRCRECNELFKQKR